MTLALLFTLMAALVPGEGFADAVDLYRSDRWAESQRAFELLLETEADVARRATLHYDAGTAAARADRLGLAVWHLEAARRLDPALSDAKQNLRMVEARLGEGVTEEAQFTQTLMRLTLSRTRGQVVSAASIGAGLALLVLAAWRARWAGRRAVSCAVGALVLIGVLLLFDATARERDLARAVVVAEQGTTIRGEPSPTGASLYRVGAGTVVTPGRVVSAWRKVILAETEGWIPADHVRLAGT